MTRTLRAVADTLTEELNLGVTRLEIRRGWGDIFHIELHSSEPSTPINLERWKSFEAEVQRKLADRRQRLEIKWARL